jgi:hypothetical protein
MARQGSARCYGVARQREGSRQNSIGGPTVRSSSEGFDQWAFAIDRRRRALLGKMDMLKG